MRDTNKGPPTFWSADDETLQRYRAIVDTVAEGLFHVDDEGRFLEVDGTFLDLTGYDRDRLRGGNTGGVLGDGFGRQGDDVWIDARRDDGATVYFALPAMEVHDG